MTNDATFDGLTYDQQQSAWADNRRMGFLYEQATREQDSNDLHQRHPGYGAWN